MEDGKKDRAGCLSGQGPPQSLYKTKGSYAKDTRVQLLNRR